MIEFEMPSLGSDMDEGELKEWLIQPGDTVTRGQVIAVVETAKAAVDVESWQEGTVQELLVPVGEKVPVGTVIATFLEKDHAPSAVASPSPPKLEPTPAAPVEPERPSGPAPSQSRSSGTQHRLWVSPAARREARRLGIDVSAVKGTGPAGSVTLDDIASAAEQPAAEQPAVDRAAADRAAAMRKSIAAHMSRSKREIPHYYLGEHVSLAAASAWLTAHNGQLSVTERVLPAVLRLKAVALAARKFPEFNGFWVDDKFEPASAVHLGVAISLRRGGLIGPAIHDVADKSLDQLMSDLTDLVRRARAGSLRSSEMSDPTLTVTDLGDQGVDSVFGVIYPPQVALVGFGKQQDRPWAEDGGLRIVPSVYASLAADHRVSDGHRGGLFLAEIAEQLRHPEQL